MTGPAAPAEGRNGRWVKLGDVGVDGATLGITDPSAVSKRIGWDWTGPERDLSQPYGSGVQFSSGFGDGGYDVWAWIVEYDTDGEPDERIAQIVVTLIDAEDLAHWNDDGAGVSVLKQGQP